jgi:hypothetical protein
MVGNSSLRFVATFVGTALALCGVLATFNFVVDPFQYYRIPTLYQPIFWSGMQRYQIATLARRYAEPVVVIGQSTTENFLPSYIQKSWGKAASKLSISASTAHEQFLALQLALRTGRVTDVLWGVDAYAFAQSPTRTSDKPAPFPAYMYRNDVISQIEYLLSGGTFRLSLLILTGKAPSTDLEHYHTWYDQFEFSRQAALSGWNRDCGIFEPKYQAGDRAPSPEIIAALRASIDQNVLSLVDQYPEITFHLFFAPYSAFFFMPPASGRLPTYLQFRKVLAASLAGHANVRLFDFEVAEPIIEDLNNYKDPLHFGMSISQNVIDAIREGRHRVRPEEIERNNERFIDIVNRYDLCQGRPAPSP